MSSVSISSLWVPNITRSKFLSRRHGCEQRYGFPFHDALGWHRCRYPLIRPEQELASHGPDEHRFVISVVLHILALLLHASDESADRTDAREHYASCDLRRVATMNNCDSLGTSSATCEPALTSSRRRIVWRRQIDCSVPMLTE